MNVYIGLLALIICTFTGYRLSVKFTDRKNFFSDFYSFNEKMINEVSFTQSPLLKIVGNENEGNRDFGKLLSEKISVKSAETDCFIPEYLKKDELSVFDDYVNNLGKSDRDTQLKFLSSKKKILEDLRINAETEEKKYKKLYLKLGFLFGLIILIALL